MLTMPSVRLSGSKTSLSEPELGELYLSKVISLKEIGVVVELFPGSEMLLHISQWDNKRTASLEGLVEHR